MNTIPITDREERIKFIKNNYELTNEQIGERFGISAKSVEKVMQRAGVKRPMEIVEQKRNAARQSGAKSLHDNYDFSGSNNPNWKDGISKNNYHYKKIQRERYPERIAARDKVHEAVKNGKLIKLPCAICGDEKVFAHHEDYSKPLEVIWLCRKHHREKHGNKY